MISIRNLKAGEDKILDLVAKRCIKTVLETIPEFDNNRRAVKKRFAQFSPKDLSRQIAVEAKKRNHKILVAENEKGKVLGHSIVAIKKDTNGVSYGLCFSRYVEPKYRRTGVASQLLEEAEKWWKKRNVAYVIAHSHTSNRPVKGLFRKFGYEVSKGQHNGTYRFNLIKKDLKAGPPDLA